MMTSKTNAPTMLMTGEMKMNSTMARSPAIRMKPRSIRTGMTSDAPQIAPSIAPNRTSSLNDAVNRPRQIAPVTAPSRPKKTTSVMLSQEGRMIAEMPATAIPAPRRPPTMAWLLEIGIPDRVATNTRMIAVPMATMIESGVSPLRVDNGGADGCSNRCREQERADHVADRGGKDRFYRGERLCCHNGCYRMRCIIEAIDKVQRKREDDAKQDERFHAGHECAIAMSTECMSDIIASSP